MSKLNKADQVILFHSVLYNAKEISVSDLLLLLKDQFGSHILFTHPYFPMKEYYSSEMGDEGDLNRFFVFYPKLFEREELVPAKLLSTKLEDQYSVDGKRVFNFDPGYISKDQVLLATGKPYSHRIYLGEGVYGELTYRYSGKSFGKLDWTYPDYSHAEIVQQFNFIRQFHFSPNLLDSNPA